MSNEEKKSTEFEDGLEGFLGADIEVEDQAFGSQYPLIQWVNGKPAGKAAGEDKILHTGGWFISADQGIEPPAGFTPYTLMTEDGTEIPGFASRDLTFSPIRSRRCWVVTPDDNSLIQRFAHSDYDSALALGKPRGVTHLIVGIEGVDEPVLLSFRGMVSKAMMGQGKDRGIIPEYGNKVIRAAKRVARQSARKGGDGKGKTFPLCTFKLTVGPARDSKGAPVFTKVGTGSNTSQITMPVWLDEPKKLVSKADLNRLFVGNETFASYQDWHRECDDWRAAWDATNLVRNPPATAGVADESGDSDGLPGEQSIPF